MEPLDKHAYYKEGKLHHTELVFTDGNEKSRRVVSARDEVKVFNDMRFIFLNGELIAFPEDADKIRYLGQFRKDHLFKITYKDLFSFIIYISPSLYTASDFTERYRLRADWSEFLDCFSGVRFAITRLLSANVKEVTRGKNPVVDKLLEVNDAEKIFFLNEACRRTMMFAKSPNKQLTEIKQLYNDDGSIIDRIILAEPTEHARQSYYEGIPERIELRKTHLISEPSLHIARPDDVVSPGILYWQAI